MSKSLNASTRKGTLSAIGGEGGGGGGMLLTPTELERLTIFTAAELARKRRAKGLKINHPEAVALITDEILEGAREGKSVAAMMSLGSTILSTADVLPGVAAMV